MGLDYDIRDWQRTRSACCFRIRESKIKMTVYHKYSIDNLQFLLGSSCPQFRNDQINQ